MDECLGCNFRKVEFLLLFDIVVFYDVTINDCTAECKSCFNIDRHA